MHVTWGFEVYYAVALLLFIGREDAVLLFCGRWDKPSIFRY